MKVQVPKAMHIGDLVRAGLTRHEGVGFERLAMATFAGSQKPVLFHEAAEGHVARHRAQARILASERAHVVVMELKAPTWMLAMQLGDRLGERRADAGVCACV